MSFYADMAATAIELLTEFGRSATHESKTTGAYDPATGSAPVTTASATCTLAIFPVTKAHVDGTLVLQTDEIAYIAPFSAAPTAGDTLLVGGVRYTIIKVMTTSPAGTTVLHECVVRK